MTIQAAGGRTHTLQFYGADERLLVYNVAHFLCDGLNAHGRALIIATRDHRGALVRAAAELQGTSELSIVQRIVQFDAGQMLARFMVAGRPDPLLFERSVATEVRRLRALGRVCAYGEMVGVLWKAGQYGAAIELEECWNALVSSADFDLFCGYPVDVFGPDFQIGSVGAVLCAHSRLLSAAEQTFEAAMQRAIDEMLGHGVHAIRMPAVFGEDGSWPNVPPVEQSILWLRNTLPRYADEILARARSYCPGAIAGRPERPATQP